jgi:hypothetical protein
MVQSSPVTPGRSYDRDTMTGWVGWVLFAGILMFTVGFFNVIEGLVALFNHGYYHVHASGLVVHLNYTAWGWALLIFGLALGFAGYGVMVGQTWARVVGVIVAVVNALVNLGFIAAYPVWITLTIALDVLVIYALIVHGREAQAMRGD